MKTKGRRGVGASKKKLEGKSNGVVGLGPVNNRVLLVGWATGNNNVVSFEKNKSEGLVSALRKINSDCRC